MAAGDCAWLGGRALPVKPKKSESVDHPPASPTQSFLPHNCVCAASHSHYLRTISTLAANAQPQQQQPPSADDLKFGKFQIILDSQTQV